jgi:hypothetical protein
MNNATKAIKFTLEYQEKFWYEAFSIVDEIPHINITKVKNILGYHPENPSYTKDQIISMFD